MRKPIIIGFVLLLALCMSGCQNKVVGKPAFETENVSAVTFVLFDEEAVFTVPPEELDTIVKWLGTYTIAKEAGESLWPGTWQASVRIEYTNGTVFENSLTTIEIDGTRYYLHCGDVPAYFLELTEP